MLINLPYPYQPLPSPPRSKQMVFYAPDQPDFLWTGGPVQIICQPILRSLSLRWSLCRNFVTTPVATGEAESGFDGSYLIQPPMDDLGPGFYDLSVRVALTATQTLKGTTTFGWRMAEEPITPVTPDDFLPFWQNAQAAGAGKPLDLRREHQFTLTGDAIGRYNRKHAALPEHYDPSGEKFSEVEVSKVDFISPLGGRVYGWFAKPPGAGPFPGLLVLPGGGSGARPAPVEHARHGYAALDVEVHGQPVDAETYPPFPGTSYTMPTEYWHYAPYLNALQAVSALAESPGVDASRLAVTGGSRGGRLSFVVAALEPRIRAAIPGITHYSYIPWLRWTEALNLAKKSGREGFGPGDIEDDLQSAVRSYYDVLNFAPLIRCPVLMNAGLIDPVSPVTGVYAAYHALSAPREIIPLPNLGHDWSPDFDRYAWRWLSATLDGPKPSRPEFFATPSVKGGF